MQKPEIWRLVLGYLMAKPSSEVTFQDWRAYINRHLLVEIQQEKMRFYGTIDCAEAMQPGLDYTNPGHRLRLAAFPRHQILFSVFKRLRLTNSEIENLCSWEGTKAAKENWEQRYNRKIVDTTWDEVRVFQRKPPTATVMTHKKRAAVPRYSELMCERLRGGEGDDDLHTSDEDLEEESEDEVVHSVGVSLNRRLLDAAAARARGEDVSIDPEWEQWIKEALERGTVANEFLSNRVLSRNPPSSEHQSVNEGPFSAVPPLPAQGRAEHEVRSRAVNRYLPTISGPQYQPTVQVDLHEPRQAQSSRRTDNMTVSGSRLPSNVGYGRPPPTYVPSSAHRHVIPELHGEITPSIQTIRQNTDAIRRRLEAAETSFAAAMHPLAQAVTASPSQPQSSTSTTVPS